MKNVMGGNVPPGTHTECWDCGGTKGGWCTSVSNAYTCREGSVTGIYLTCMNGTTFETLNFTCEAN